MTRALLNSFVVGCEKPWDTARKATETERHRSAPWLYTLRQVFSPVVLPRRRVRRRATMRATCGAQMLALMGAAALPPPPPPPLMPLELGETACQDLSLPMGHRAVYSVFGGSNTQGANAAALNSKGGTVYGRGNPSFAHLLAKRLKDTHVSKWNADGGSGPILAGTCASAFVPPDTRLGTIEYLPNLGYIHEDQAEVGAIKAMLHMMRARGAAAFLVNIVSGTKRYENDARGGGQGLECRKQNYRENVIGCMGRVRLLAFRDKLARAANETGAQVITIDADEVPHLFGADSFHLNAHGHRTVFNEIWRLYRALPCAEHRDLARTELGRKARPL